MGLGLLTPDGIPGMCALLLQHSCRPSFEKHAGAFDGRLLLLVSADQPYLQVLFILLVLHQITNLHADTRRPAQQQAKTQQRVHQALHTCMQPQRTKTSAQCSQADTSMPAVLDSSANIECKPEKLTPGLLRLAGICRTSQSCHCPA